jgi:3-deoxy-D-manno-octulosonic-acid transferase
VARPVLLAASTREGEEELLLDALASVPGVANLLVLIVPRHPQRFDEVARRLERRAIPYARRSANEKVAQEVRVVLGDSMGEMFAYYAASDVAFIGGSLLPYGGQNLIEACAVGVPVLIGPHTFNFEEATRQAVACGAAVRVATATEAFAEAARLLADAPARKTMSEAGRAFAALHRGATARTLEVVENFLPKA